MTNLELAKQLLFMIDTESSVQNMVLVNAVARLLDEPDEKAQDKTDPEEVEPEQEKPERKKEEKEKPDPKEKREAKKTKKTVKKQIDWGKAGACLKAGWPVSKIADELGCSEAAVYAHFKKYGGGGGSWKLVKRLSSISWKNI